MANTIRIKRRAAGIGAGAPSGLANAELAYNEGDNILYYGFGAGGAGGTATQVIPIAGSGAYLNKNNNLSDLNNLQTSRNNLAGSVSGGLFMRGNGTNVLMGSIIASDVPTLNQSTTGSAGSVTSSLTINNGGAGDSSGSTFNGSSAKTISYNSIGAPSISGANATGTWNISISGNASTVTSGVYTGRTLTAGSGLVGGGDLSSDKTFNIGQGDGISVSADSIAVDSTVIRTTGTQTLSGAKTFTNQVIFSGNLGQYLIFKSNNAGNYANIVFDGNNYDGATQSSYITSNTGNMEIAHGQKIQLNSALEVKAANTSGNSVGYFAVFDSNPASSLTTLKSVSKDQILDDIGAATSGLTLTAGSGLTGGGTLSTDRTFHVGQGDGITVSADTVAVDSTVVRTTGTQSIGGVKTFSNRPIFSSGITTNFIQSQENDSLELNANGNGLLLTNSDYLEINSFTDIINNYGGDGGLTSFVVNNSETNKKQLVLSTGSIVLNDNVTSSGNISITNQTASTIASFDSNKNVVSLSTSTYPSLTELSYSKGVTSAIQTQLNNKIAKTSSTTIGNIPTWSVTTGDALGTGYSVETTLTGGSSSLPRADAVKTYVDNIVTSGFSVNDAMVFKGTLGSGGTVTTLPTGIVSAGWSYRVITTGIYAGAVSEIGDLIIAVADASGNVNSTWTVVQTNIDGAVVGPASATDNALAVFNGTTGKLIKNSSFVPTTVGGNLINLANPSAITFPKINADNTVSTESNSNYRTSLGATTVGSNLFTLTNPSGVSFVRMNADNTVTSRSASELKTDLTLNNVENTALSTWAGSTNLTTLGAVATGTWSATTIAVNKGGTGQTSYTNGELLIGNTTSNTLTKATLTQGTNVTITNGNGSITIASTDTNTATAADDILDGSNTGTQITYAPYATNQAASASPRFYNTSDNPSGSGRLNVSAYFYATNLYDNGSRVVTASTICTDAANCTWDGGTF